MVVIVPSTDALKPVAAVPPTQSEAGCWVLPHSSGVNAVTVAATSPSARWQITGTAVPDAPSNETPHPRMRISVVAGVATCTTVLTVPPTRATTVGINGVVVPRGPIAYSAMFTSRKQYFLRMLIVAVDCELLAAAVFWLPGRRPA